MSTDRSIMGGHLVAIVHKCLKVSSYNQIITIKIYGPFSIYSQRMSTHFAQQSCPSLTATAHSICKKHKKVMALFSDCHQMYNSAEEMTSTDADVLGMLKLLLLLIYRCCYCQISIISFYLSTSHNNTQNALLGVTTQCHGSRNRELGLDF